MPLYCSHCGAENADKEHACSSCRRAIGHVADTSTGVVGASDTPNRLTSIVIAIVCAMYLVFPTLGVFELIPDALPFVGSLDEAAATTGLWIALSRLGLNPFGK